MIIKSLVEKSVEKFNSLFSIVMSILFQSSHFLYKIYSNALSFGKLVIKNCEQKVFYDQNFITIAMTWYILWKSKYIFPLPPFSINKQMRRWGIRGLLGKLITQGTFCIHAGMLALWTILILDCLWWESKPKSLSWISYIGQVLDFLRVLCLFTWLYLSLACLSYGKNVELNGAS